MPRAVEHDHHQIPDVPAERARDRAEIVLDRRVQIYRMLRRGTDDELLHVEIGRVQQAAPLGRGQHGNRVRRARRAQVRPLERIDRDVNCRIAPLATFRVVGQADLLADIQHRRLVPLSLADDNRAVDRHPVHLAAHGFHRDLIGFVTVPLSHRVRAGNGRLLDDAEEIQ